MLDTTERPAPETAAAPPYARAAEPLITVRDVSLWYGEKQALRSVSLDLWRHECLAFIGPSGCGKSTLLKCLNRMHDGIRDVRQTGCIRLDGVDIRAPAIDPPLLRRRFGWVAQRPNPFAWSVRENIAYGPRLHGIATARADLDAIVESCLRRADLWEEVKDRLGSDALDLSGGQQQRLCIARALSTSPDVLLMDEPCGSVDPIATARIEAMVIELRRQIPVVIITHNLAQAARVADRVAFFRLGELLEIGTAEQVFRRPQNPWCAGFVAGAYG